MCRRLLQLGLASCTEPRRRRCKRYLSYFVICCNFFLGGFEYGVIFPTASEYLEQLGAGAGEQTYFGLLIVSYAMANIGGGYVGGLWADTLVETRPLLVMAALPQIVGNALYFFAATPGQLVASRALSGVGSGANTAMLAELTRTTSLRHRTSVISVVTFARQLGIVFGPAVGAYLTTMPDVFRHRVTLLNAPGLLLTFCYVVYMVLLTLLYSNLTVDEDESGSDSDDDEISSAAPFACAALLPGDGRQAAPEVSEAVPAPPPPPGTPLFLSLPQPGQPAHSSWPPCPRLAGGWSAAELPAAAGSSAEANGPAPREIRLVLPAGWDCALQSPAPCLCPRCPAAGAVRPSSPAPGRAASASVLREWRELLCWPVAALLLCNFAAYLAQTSLEAALPALVKYDLALDIDATGRLFTVGGLVQCAVLGCIFATPLLPALRDQRLISAGLIIMAAAHVDLAVTLSLVRRQEGVAGAEPPPPPGRGWFWALLVGSGVQFFGYPLVNSVATSFLSKLLSRGAQGVGAAGLRVSMCAGLMVGPLWGSGLQRRPLALFLAPLALLLLCLLVFGLLERRGQFRVRMREAAVVDTVTPRVCAAPRRVRTISALSHIREVYADAVKDGSDGETTSDTANLL